jgi:heme exporter protein CcmD
VPKFQFDGLADFFAMGGYAFYVWLAYAFFFVVMGWNLIQPRLERRRILKLLQARQAREERNATVPTQEEREHA